MCHFFWHLTPHFKKKNHCFNDSLCAVLYKGNEKCLGMMTHCGLRVQRTLFLMDSFIFVWLIDWLIDWLTEHSVIHFFPLFMHIRLFIFSIIYLIICLLYLCTFFLPVCSIVTAFSMQIFPEECVWRWCNSRTSSSVFFFFIFFLQDKKVNCPVKAWHHECWDRF